MLLGKKGGVKMVLRCPKCNEELEIPDKCVGWKVQCIYCNEKFFATEELARAQQEALKKKTLRIAPVKRNDACLHTIAIKRPSRTTTKAGTAARSCAPRKDACRKQPEVDVLDRATRQAADLLQANGWDAKEFARRMDLGHIRLIKAPDGLYDVVVASGDVKAAEGLVRRMTQKKTDMTSQSGTAKRGYTVVDGVEIPDGSPFWMYVPAWIIILTFPLWIIPYLIYAVFRSLDPNYVSDYEKMVRLGIEDPNDDAWSYEARERWQWTLGTGAYADDYR